MSFHFTLCDMCLTKYRALQFDPAARMTYSLMPFGSLIWLDEHPDGPPLTSYDESTEEMHDLKDHDQCRSSIIRLAATRTALWQLGNVPAERKTLWEEALKLLPEWPGFRRLTLNDEEKKELQQCFEESGDLMGMITNDFPNVVHTDEGGGLTSFTASKLLEELKVRDVRKLIGNGTDKGGGLTSFTASKLAEGLAQRETEKSKPWWQFWK